MYIINRWLIITLLKRKFDHIQQLKMLIEYSFHVIRVFQPCATFENTADLVAINLNHSSRDDSHKFGEQSTIM